MTDKKTHCAELYKMYIELDRKTHINVETYVPGKPLKPQYINPEELLKKEEIRKELLDCKDFLDLKPDVWFEIENG